MKILHLEDDVQDCVIIQRWISDENIAAEFVSVDNETDFIRAFNGSRFDVILSDKSIPGFDGLGALRYVRERDANVPFIFVTGSMGETAAIQTMKEGATDYVLKEGLNRLVPAIQRSIHEAELEMRRRHMEEKNREQAQLLDKAQDAIYVIDAEDRILFWNVSAERIYGWPASSAIGRKASSLLPTDPVKYQEGKKVVLEKGSWMGEIVAANRGGNELFIESRWTLVRDELGQPKTILIIDTDITERKALEAKFLRSQRMDSIGALAGGIAHDLNNALAPVIMGAELLRDCDDEVSRNKFLDVVHSNAQRATGLVKQILSFARGSSNPTGPIQMKDLISEMAKMIRDTFPKSISLELNFPSQEIWSVQGDTTELHQVLMNLCVNARDAMPKGGQLTLTAENVQLDSENALAMGGSPGSHVMVSVRDTGTGIPTHVLPRIFEPFFTTKPSDKGTGLGLATVAAIVKHHNGFIDIQTEAGRGTQFKIYFPATAVHIAQEAAPKASSPPIGHGELILVIDDEETLLEMIKNLLETFGYRVIAAPNGAQGIARFKEHEQDIRLLVTDTDMPQMDGMDAIRAIRTMRPDVPVIIASGSKHDASEMQEIGPERLTNLGKPFSLDQLLVAVDSSLHH